MGTIYIGDLIFRNYVKSTGLQYLSGLPDVTVRFVQGQTCLRTTWQIDKLSGIWHLCGVSFFKFSGIIENFYSDQI